MRSKLIQLSTSLTTHALHSIFRDSKSHVRMLELAEEAHSAFVLDCLTGTWRLPSFASRAFKKVQPRTIAVAGSIRKIRRTATGSKEGLYQSVMH